MQSCTKFTNRDDVYVDDEEVLTKIIKAIYKKAEKEHLNTEIVAELVGDLQYIFHKNPKKKDKRCYVCKKGLSSTT